MKNKLPKQLSNILYMSIGIFLLMQLLNWLLGNKIAFDNKMLQMFLYTVLYTFCLGLANFGVFHFLDRHFTEDRFSRKRVIIGFVGSFLISLLTIFMLRIFEDVVIENRSFAEFINKESPGNYIFAIIITFFVTLSLYAFNFYKAYQDNKVKEQKIIAGTASAKFESLKNQIDPHFLFNSLNVLSSLIEENPENAQRFTTSLSKVYRYVLEQKDKELVSVEEELAFAKTYMNLLKMRFENSLFYELPTSISNPDAKVVPLSLQLLLENTVKHNVVSEKKPLHIRIFEGNDYLVIQNDLQKKEVLQDRQGVGLQNIISRYHIITKRKVLIDQNENMFSVKIPILTRQITVVDTDSTNARSEYQKAEKKVKDIKGFYANLITYIVVIGGLAILNFATSPEYWWFLFPAGGWGIGLIFYGLTVFNVFPFLGKDWEEKKVAQLMEQYKTNKWK